MITIVDYGMGNVGSILNMLKRLGHRAVKSSDPEVICQAEKLILPGVGAFDSAMRRLGESNLIELLKLKVVIQRTPILGICLGAQLFTRRSEEGSCRGFDWVDADTLKIAGPDVKGLKVPHMGWNYVTARREDPILDGISPRELRFYFVHSFHIVCENSADVVATSSYGIDVTAIVRRQNIVGVQFHPEKSHRFGMRLLHNFVTGS